MLKMFFAVTTIIALLLFSCTTVNLSGGTETGNPSLAVAAAFKLGDTTDVWLPSHYLVNEHQLDPGFISEKPELKLQKRLSDTSISNPSEIDTIIVIDSVFIKDTSYSSHIVTDTITDTTEWGLNLKILQNNVFDTIYNNNLILRKDTFYINKTSPAPKIYTDSVKIILHPIPSTSQNAGDISVIWAVRQTNYAGVTVNEEYSDGDGDNILLKSQLSSPKSWLHATYSTSSSVVKLDILFDAGTDRQFSSTNDNRIYTLQRTSTANNENLLSVSYRTNYNSLPNDSSILIVSKKHNEDSLISSTTRYNCIPGNIPENHLLNKLCSIDQSLIFKGSNLVNIELHLKPDTLLLEGQNFTSALLIAKLYFGRGRIGELSGKIDYTSGTFSGSYFSNGIEYKANYSRKTGKMDLFEIP